MKVGQREVKTQDSEDPATGVLTYNPESYLLGRLSHPQKNKSSYKIKVEKGTVESQRDPLKAVCPLALVSRHLVIQG